MRRLALVVLFLVVACGSIGVQAHTISVGYKAGDTYKYTLHMALKFTVGASGFSLPLDLDLVAKDTASVKSVDSSGTADVSVTLTDMTTKSSMNGTTTTTTTTTPRTVELKIAPDGRIVSVNGTATGMGSLPGLEGQGGLVSAILPDHAVKPGDTWSKTYSEPGPSGSGAIQVTSDNKYLRDETVSGVSTSLIESKIKHNLDLTLDLSALAGSMGGSGSNEMPLPSGGISGATFTVKGTGSSDVKSWIDTSARRVVKTHSSGSLDATLTVTMPPGSATPGLNGPITIKGALTLDLTPA
jgi:hypothetical protein